MDPRCRGAWPQGSSWRVTSRSSSVFLLSRVRESLLFFVPSFLLLNSEVDLMF